MGGGVSGATVYSCHRLSFMPVLARLKRPARLLMQVLIQANGTGRPPITNSATFSAASAFAHIRALPSVYDWIPRVTLESYRMHNAIQGARNR